MSSSKSLLNAEFEVEFCLQLGDFIQEIKAIFARCDT